MSDYRPPVEDMQFLLHDVLGFSHDDLDRETTSAILDEAAKLASGILAPLNVSGDQNGAKLVNGEVKTAKGFKEAYAAYCEGGWNAVPFEPEYGGQGLPWALAFPVQEMWQGANMSFGLCPLLNQASVEAISSHGSPEQKEYYLAKLISGEWTGTMNLTESNSGSDLGLIRMKAYPKNGGAYAITGQKIFITYGDHDLTENIIHMVLARIDGAPDGIKGISLFVVPKILEDGSQNTVKPIGLEHKLGIHASPTCTMDFDGATGYLIGEENCGLKYMFTMMNNARLCVGLQGVAIAQRSYQHAKLYASERVQGKSFDNGERVSIDQHADVRRMLMEMKSLIMAGRALAYSAAIELDRAALGDENAQKKVEILTPIVKAWCTDMAVDVTSTGIQIHGGMGFIEETGAAQYYRDARILPIYEGTNGIQAADFVFRKTLRDGAVGVKSYIKEMAKFIDGEILESLNVATDVILKCGSDKDLDRAAWLSTPYLKAFGIIAGGAMMARIYKSPSDSGEIKESCVFYKENILPLSWGYLKIIS